MMRMRSSGSVKTICHRLLFVPRKKCYNLFMLDVRPSPIAGTWYEGNAKTLAHSVDEYLNNAQLPELDGEVVGVIAPHAGHRYSGAVAGHAFAAIFRAGQNALRLRGEEKQLNSPPRAELVAVNSHL